MARLGFNLVRAKEKSGDCESTSSFAGENDEAEDILQAGKYVRHQEPGKKLYLLFLVCTTVVACFCVFVVIPQLVDYFTAPKVLNIENSICAPQKQSVIELLDTERSRRNQERLEIMHKVNALQRNYKLLQIEYRKAQEMFLKKLHNAYKYEESVDSKQQSLQTQPVASSSEQTEMEIFELDNTTANIHEDESERPPAEKISQSSIVVL